MEGTQLPSTPRAIAARVHVEMDVLSVYSGTSSSQAA